MRNIEVLIIITITDEEGPETQSFHGSGDVMVMQALKDADTALNTQFDLDRANSPIPTVAADADEEPRPRYAD